VASFSRRVPGLQDVFPSSGVSAAQPTEVSESVTLTHPFLAAGTRFEEMVLERVIGAVDIAFANLPIVPEGRYWYVPAWSISHSDGTARQLTWELEERDMGNFIVLESTGQMGNGGNHAAQTRLGLRRPILIGPGWRGVAGANAMAGGGFITTLMLRVEYPLAEQPPPY